MKTIEYFEVTKNTDGTEGRGATIGTGIAFEKEQSAIDFANSKHYKKYAVMGYVSGSDGRYNVRKMRVSVYDSFKSFDEKLFKEEKEKSDALDKLTEKEKKILGLTKIK